MAFMMAPCAGTGALDIRGADIKRVSTLKHHSAAKNYREVGRRMGSRVDLKSFELSSSQST